LRIRARGDQHALGLSVKQNQLGAGVDEALHHIDA
jgi:hypothetical protein